MKFYLIGAGVIARSHADAILKLPNGADIEVKVADPNPHALNEFVKLHPKATPFSDAKVMLAEEAKQNDIVVIGTPPFTHFELSRLALESGRHVLCEKPLVMKREEGEILLEIANRKNLLLGCCSDRFLGLQKTEEIKRLLQSDAVGEVYKVTFVYRGQRSRPGVEYQPESKWFLDRSKSGGGIVMDWGPYDFAVLNDIFKPSAVEVSAAWVSKPETEVDPVDTVYDIEGHVGAMLKYHLDGKAIWVQYERASCTHGEAYHHVEIEGTRGALQWSPYFESDKVIYTRDKAGEVVTEEKEIVHEGNIGFMDNPVYYFYKKVKGEASPALTNEQTIFNFSCVQSLYDYVETGTVQRIEAGVTKTNQVV
ncbi:Gfo/Idh/MocA family protein [Sutcliffiella halmapala]|uniref:Gfo/Idh/MocA family protein n=1 Tax=Sutcliffiella halmapala TaxID=79882 RepID=UPI00099498AC|nr:Gfo/Idh/MocA family oxidoreductase [Sutcliffiella halmapala]